MSHYETIREALRDFDADYAPRPTPDMARPYVEHWCRFPMSENNQHASECYVCARSNKQVREWKTRDICMECFKKIRALNKFGFGG